MSMPVVRNRVELQIPGYVSKELVRSIVRSRLRSRSGCGTTGIRQTIQGNRQSPGTELVYTQAIDRKVYQAGGTDSTDLILRH